MLLQEHGGVISFNQLTNMFVWENKERGMVFRFRMDTTEEDLMELIEETIRR